MSASAELAAPEQLLDFAALERTPLQREPFEYLVLPGFLPAAAAAAARECFPVSAHGGIEPASARDPNDALGRLLTALRAPETSAAFGRKFGLALSPESLMINLRSRCRAKDGKIHTDSIDKVVTCLLYLNESWPHAGGRLRLLRRPDDLEDMIGEVLPLDGTLVAFRRSDRSFHGHHPHEGVRRYIMFNWMTDAKAARRETWRHSVSAVFKRLAG